MRTPKSRRVKCAFESLEGRALTASYARLEGIDGSVTAQQPAEVRPVSPAEAATRTGAHGSGGGGGAGKVSMNDFHF